MEIQRFLNEKPDDRQKAALLNFIVDEFDLKSSFLISHNTQWAVESTIQNLARDERRLDLLIWTLTEGEEVDIALAEMLFVHLAPRAMVIVNGKSSMLEDFYRGRLIPVLVAQEFTVFSRIDGVRSAESIRYQLDLHLRKLFFNQLRKARSVERTGSLPLVAVIVLAYNHEKYIEQCLKSVTAQHGDFRMRLIIAEDVSTDNTVARIKQALEKCDVSCIDIDLHINPENLGMVKNFASAVRLAAGCDYMTFCEGDDFWSSDRRIQKHIDYLKMHPECVMSFNSIEFCDSDGKNRKIWAEHLSNKKDFFDGNDLAEINISGNLACCFYDGAVTEVLPDSLFEMFTGDWMFNMYCSQFGRIGFLRQALSVYRQHTGGIWSGRDEWDRVAHLAKLVEEYNRYLDFQFSSGFENYTKRLEETMEDSWPEKMGKHDLIVYDDIFPAPLSGFRLEEFTSYLKEFSNVLIYTSGVSVGALGKEKLPDLIRSFQRKHPDLSAKIKTIPHYSALPAKRAKLLYMDFLTHAYELLPIAEEAKVPFVFTLYPGGSFVLNNPDCDRKLKRIFDSPSFLKVIVTQQITYDYLINRGLCPPDKVEMIFGVVMPQDSFADPIPKDKIRWGFGKKRLDICFMAHRYTLHGEDKGYDVFVNVAYRLQSFDNIYFHVVGPYDDRILDIYPIRDRIKFYGTLNPEQLDDFFNKMDIIMSPNISGKLLPGAFDGFPTASCTEGGLRGTVIFCTDEYNSATGRFTGDEDFVNIKYDLDHIVERVEYYYRNPEKLKAIGENGSRRIQELYSYKSQMAPRIRILRELIESPFVFDVVKLRGLKPCTPESPSNSLNVVLNSIPSPIWGWLRKHCPEFLKIFYRKFVKKRIALA